MKRIRNSMADLLNEIGHAVYMYIDLNCLQTCRADYRLSVVAAAMFEYPDEPSELLARTR